MDVPRLSRSRSRARSRRRASSRGRRPLITLRPSDDDDSRYRRRQITQPSAHQYRSRRRGSFDADPGNRAYSTPHVHIPPMSAPAGAYVGSSPLAALSLPPPPPYRPQSEPRLSRRHSYPPAEGYTPPTQNYSLPGQPVRSASAENLPVPPLYPFLSGYPDSSSSRLQQDYATPPNSGHLTPPPLPGYTTPPNSGYTTPPTYSAYAAPPNSSYITPPPPPEYIPQHPNVGQDSAGNFTYKPTQQIEHRFAGWLFNIRTQALPESKELKIKVKDKFVEYHCSGVLLTKIRYRFKKDVFSLYEDPNVHPLQDKELIAKIEILVACIVARIFKDKWSFDDLTMAWGASQCSDIGDNESISVDVVKESTGSSSSIYDRHNLSRSPRRSPSYGYDVGASDLYSIGTDAFQRQRSLGEHSRYGSSPVERSQIIAVLRRIELLTAMSFLERPDLPASDVASVIGEKSLSFQWKLEPVHRVNCMCYGNFKATVPTLFGVLVSKMRRYGCFPSGRTKRTSDYYGSHDSEDNQSPPPEEVGGILNHHPGAMAAPPLTQGGHSNLVIPTSSHDLESCFTPGTNMSEDTSITGSQCDCDSESQDSYDDPFPEWDVSQDSENNSESRATASDMISPLVDSDASDDRPAQHTTLALSSLPLMSPSNGQSSVPPNSADEDAPVSPKLPVDTTVSKLEPKEGPVGDDTSNVPAHVACSMPIDVSSGLVRQESSADADNNTNSNDELQVAISTKSTKSPVTDSGLSESVSVTDHAQQTVVNNSSKSAEPRQAQGGSDEAVSPDDEEQNTDKEDEHKSPQRAEQHDACASADESENEGQTQNSYAEHDTNGSTSESLESSDGHNNNDQNELSQRDSGSTEVTDENDSKSTETTKSESPRPGNTSTRPDPTSILRKGRTRNAEKVKNVSFSSAPPENIPISESPRKTLPEARRDQERNEALIYDDFETPTANLYNETQPLHSHAPPLAQPAISPYTNLIGANHPPSVSGVDPVRPLYGGHNDIEQYKEAVNAGEVYSSEFYQTPEMHNIPSTIPPEHKTDSSGDFSLPTPATAGSATSGKQSAGKWRILGKVWRRRKRSSNSSHMDYSSIKSDTTTSSVSTPYGARGKNWRERPSLQVAKDLLTVILGGIIFILAVLAIALDPAEEKNWFKRLEEGVFVMFSLGTPLLLATNERVSDNFEIVLPKTEREVHSIKDLQNMNKGMNYETFIKQLQKAIAVNEELSDLFSFKDASYKLSRKSGKLEVPSQAKYGKMMKAVWFFGEELAFNKMLGKAFRYHHANNVLRIEKESVNIEGVIVHVRRRAGKYTLGSPPD